MMMGVTKINKLIPSPCKKDCPNRTATCKIDCKKYQAYEKIKLYQDKKQVEIVQYKLDNYISWEDKYKQYKKEKKNDQKKMYR